MTKTDNPIKNTFDLLPCVHSGLTVAIILPPYITAESFCDHLVGAMDCYPVNQQPKIAIVPMGFTDLIFNDGALKNWAKTVVDKRSEILSWLVDEHTFGEAATDFPGLGIRRVLYMAGYVDKELQAEEAEGDLAKVDLSYRLTAEGKAILQAVIGDAPKD